MKNAKSAHPKPGSSTHLLLEAQRAESQIDADLRLTEVVAHREAGARA
ncbi:MAG TPA: hypothetical protein VLK83_08980 [Rhodanobacteraceae bacterium]|nr:hypothetical protein [Rhodanobacteraceae bacterium]